MEDAALREEMVKVCEEQGLVADEGFIQKMLQLKSVIDMRHGIMVVGKSGVGKVSIMSFSFFPNALRLYTQYSLSVRIFPR